MSGDLIPNPVMQRVAGNGLMPPEKNTVEVWRGEAVHWFNEYRDTKRLLEDQIANSAPRRLDNLIANISTPQAIADATRTVAQLLIAGRITAESGRTALYALQVCLTAMRISAKVKEGKNKCSSARTTTTAAPSRQRRHVPNPKPRKKKARKRSPTRPS